MALEIERKFLVHKSLLPDLKEGLTIIQGYLAENPSVRFRLMGSKMVMTVKEYYPQGRRFELETPPQEITAEEAAKLQELAISEPISKIRYRLLERGLVWELDVYQGVNEGLITVDVELPSADYPLEFPDWVNRDREITADERYTNLNLSRKPYTAWEED